MLAAVNPSTLLAGVVIDELIAGGVREAVLSPGSRNAPLSFALQAADAAGRLRLHVRLDERGAGFLALGLSARSGRPVPVVCTSGTAVANLHPAVLEAHHGGVPLLVLSADRPPELYGTGANQTVQQAGLYGTAVRWAHTLDSAGGNALWRSAVCRALAAAGGSLTGDPGPVQLNVALRPPLVPAGAAGSLPPGFAGRPDHRPWTSTPPAVLPSSPHPLPAPPLAKSVPPAADGGRVLVVAGQGAVPAVPDWLWSLPRVAEPGSPLWPGSLAAGPWLLGTLTDPDGGGPGRPDQVIVVGRPTLHRSVQDLLADPAVEVTVLPAGPRWTDVAGTASAVVTALPAQPPRCSPAWVDALRAADRTAAGAVAGVLDRQPWPTGLAVARELVAALPPWSLLVLGSSNTIRDVALAAAPRADLTVQVNRGVAGIDGMVSTAVGAALAHDGPSYALLGDLTFLHDSTALVIGPEEPRPDLTIVVFNDDGGGIFSLLEQGAPEYEPVFERVFGTPHGVRLAQLCAASGIAHTAVSTSAEFEAALTVPSGLAVVEVRAARRPLRGLHASLRAAVARS